MTVKTKEASIQALAMRVTGGQDHMTRYMQTRNEIMQYESLDPSHMSDDERRLYNKCVYIPMREATQVSSFLEDAEQSNYLGANSFLWIQGDAGTGKTTLALEASARHLYPGNVGAQAARPNAYSGVVYDHVPICCISGQGSQIAGLMRAGCTWYGIDAPKTGAEAGDRLGRIVHHCDTRVIIIDDLHGLTHVSKSMDEFRVALNKLAATVIFTSVHRRAMAEYSVAAALADETPAAEQILTRTTPVTLEKIRDKKSSDVRNAILLALESFKLLDECADADVIAEWLLEESQTNRRLASLPLVYNRLRTVAARAVGREETVTLPRVIAAA